MGFGRQIVCFLVLVSAMSSRVHAAISSASSGYWTNGATWVGNTVPGPGADVIISSGHTVTNTDTNEVSISSLTVNGILTHAANGTSYVHSLNMNVSGNVNISGTGAIDVTGKGYAGGTAGHPTGYGPGAGASSWSGGGGAYGAEGGGDPGGNSPDVGGKVVYGSVTNPVDIGSGGGYGTWDSNVGGSGGGYLKLSIGGTLTVDGSIAADGNPSTSGGHGGGGGSGGSIMLVAGTLAGSASIHADGGKSDGSGNAGGSGGGGRVAVYWGARTHTGAITARGGLYGPGGTKGGAGTVYLKQNNQNADLIIENGIASMLFSNGTWMANDVLNSLSSLSISNGGMLKCFTQTVLEITIPTITIGTNGSIDLTGKGYPGGDAGHRQGYGTGGGFSGSSSSGGGGGYGGAGGNSYDTYGTGGCAYGYAMTPTNCGSGGGYDVWDAHVGGSGGGAMKLTVSTLTVDGALVADGVSQWCAHTPGGGSGGSIWIDASTLLGAGTMRANGGSAFNADRAGGGGGGGRVAVYYTTLAFDTNNITVNGGGAGIYSGTNGTIYIAQNSSGMVVLFQ